MNANVEPPQTATEMGIRIGATVIKTDWYPSGLAQRMRALSEDGGKGGIKLFGHNVERKNRIRLSAGDDLWDCLPKHFSCEMQ
jgi:hypothetical protein